MTGRDSSDLLIPLRTMQFIAAALFMGAMAFLGVTLFLRFGQAGAQPPPEIPTISYILTGVFVMNLFLALIIPSLFLRLQIQRISSIKITPSHSQDFEIPRRILSELLAIRSTQLIITLAFIEGGTFACIVAFLIEGQIFMLIPVALGLFVILLLFPTESRLEHWLTEQEERLQELRRNILE